jgi:DnaJ-class molecular chaperone
MPHLGSSGHGDLYAKVFIFLPTNLSPRERELFQELEIIRGAR